MLLCTTSPVTPTIKKLSLMEDVGHKFQLTGSRFFGTDTEKSDWDFFAQDSAGVRLWLKTNGFTSHVDECDYADDGFCVCVFAFHGERERFNPSQQIHVQLVKDFALKQKIQNQLAALYPGAFTTDKLLAKGVWRMAFEFYKMGINDGYQSGVNHGCKLTTIAFS